MTATALERGLWIAAHGPRGAAFVHEGVLHVALAPVEWVSEHDPAHARTRFADAVEAWREPGAGSAPRAFGWLAYDALRHDEPGASSDPRPRGDRAPLAYLARYDAVLSVPLEGGAPRIEALTAEAGRRLERAWMASGEIEPATATALETRSATGAQAHHDAVETVREAIRAGEVYLVNVARMVHADAGLTRAAMAQRIAASRAPYAALIDGGEACIGGMSMELALGWDRASDRLETRPIKGTRPRHADPAHDARLATELAADPKERAENAMAVDVHRNDLGRVAAPGSVQVPALCAVERHAFVHHLVSTVQARARAGLSVRELLECTLPVGSVTGAPKRSAMSLIARVERERRGVYTGVYGAVGADGSLTLAVAIRTMVGDAEGLHYGAGGGIVFDSVPEREWQELSWKERALAGR
jgi:anthranilate/para-aminobenzoate synthase component I